MMKKMIHKAAFCIFSTCVKEHSYIRRGKKLFKAFAVQKKNTEYGLHPCSNSNSLCSEVRD